MNRLLIVLAALAAVFVSSGASSAEIVVGTVERCPAPDAPEVAYNAVRQTKEPFFYKNANGEADDALAIRLTSLLSGGDLLDCVTFKAVVAQNPHNEPNPVKGTKWHMLLIDGKKQKISLIAEALEDFVTVKTEGKIKICRRPGIVNAANKTNLGVPASVHYVKIENDKIVFDLALTEGALLGPQPNCAIVGAKLDSWHGTGIQVTTNSGELKPSGSIGQGSAGYWTDTVATVVEDFK